MDIGLSFIILLPFWRLRRVSHRLNNFCEHYHIDLATELRGGLIIRKVKVIASGEEKKMEKLFAYLLDNKLVSKEMLF